MNSNFMKMFTIIMVAFSVSFVGVSYAEEQEAGEEAQAPPGILPIPGYGEDITERDFLTGDWNGTRTSWASDHGFQWNIDTITWADKVFDGGTNDDTEVGGLLTYNLNWDLMRAGILPGALISLRADTRWGSSGNLNTGRAVPMNLAALSPTNYSAIDDGYDLALTQLIYLQMLSTKFGLIGGKFDMYGDGDLNEFATGRGRTQFSNWSLNYLTPNLVVPASTVGLGVVYLPNPNLTVQSLLTSGTDCTHTSCFDDLNDKGGVSVTQVTYQYQLGGLPGGVNGQFIYLFDKDFTDLGGITPLPPPPGFEGSTKDHSWIVGGSFFQYISTDEDHEGPLNLTNRVQDLAGWGIYGRVAFADEDTNPWATSFALGLGARGIFAGRPNDMFGVGYYYTDISSKLFRDRINSHQGAEAYYNLAILPSLRVSFNVQWIKALSPRIELVERLLDPQDAWAISTRLQVVF